MTELFEFKDAICYSGFRDGQSPQSNTFPSYEEIKEDLLILHGRWHYLRLYNCDIHAERTLEVIKNEKLDFKVMLGAYIEAEVSNAECPWGGEYSQEQLNANKLHNEAVIEKLIKMGNAYPKIIASLSVGNEATVSWTDHMVPVESVIAYTQKVKNNCSQPVTFCENYVPWLDKLKPLVDVVDFISIHTYPVWEYKNIEDGMAFTIDNYESVANAYPEKPVVITEAGWCTNSNGRGIEPIHVSEELQKIYLAQLEKWSRENKIITYVFEAFDESWKGSDHPLEPEKHWGLYNIDRTPKLVMKEAELQSSS
ncbi:MAG: glycosyl hydrolase [Bacteroidia bacterium]